MQPYRQWLTHTLHVKEYKVRDFPSGPEAKTLHSQCMGPGFDPWSGNLIPYAATKSSHAATKTQCSQIKKKKIIKSG